MLKLKFATIDMVKKFIIHIYKNKTIKMYKNDISKKNISQNIYIQRG